MVALLILAGASLAAQAPTCSQDCHAVVGQSLTFEGEHDGKANPQLFRLYVGDAAVAEILAAALVRPTRAGACSGAWRLGQPVGDGFAILRNELYTNGVAHRDSHLRCVPTNRVFTLGTDGQWHQYLPAQNGWASRGTADPGGESLLSGTIRIRHTFSAPGVYEMRLSAANEQEEAKSEILVVTADSPILPTPTGVQVVPAS